MAYLLQLLNLTSESTPITASGARSTDDHAYR
jgi:hypothetical protein